MRCSFCGRSQSQVDKIIKGPSVHICNECVKLCNEVLTEEQGQTLPWETGAIPKPVEIGAFLEEYVIGQERAKKILAVAVYNHYKRIRSTVELDGVELEKSNIMVIGPTGTGKTLLAQTLAKVLQVPFCIADATILTEAGYVGEDVENILVRLLQAAEYDVSRAEKGILYLDEVDKITRKNAAPSVSRDVSGEGVQQALLKIIEGTVANVPPKGGRKHPQQDFLQIDTTNILFICGGAFVGLDKIIERRIGKQSLGFAGTREKSKAKKIDKGVILGQTRAEDLLKFGLIPEFVGRVPVVATLNELDEPALVRILKEPKNALVKQYQKLLEFENVKLKFTDGALRAISREAIERKSGARGLRAILERLMLDVMYDVPSVDNVKECIVSEEVVASGKQPILVYENEAELA